MLNGYGTLPLLQCHSAVIATGEGRREEGGGREEGEGREGVRETDR